MRKASTGAGRAEDVHPVVGLEAPCPGGHDAGYLNGGTGWYRKTFTLPEAARQQRVFLEFDGVYMDSDVWVNGHHLGKHPYGYTGFQYDLTPHVRYGTPANVVAVRVNVKQPCSRWRW